MTIHFITLCIAGTDVGTDLTCTAEALKFSVNISNDVDAHFCM